MQIGGGELKSYWFHPLPKCLTKRIEIRICFLVGMKSFWQSLVNKKIDISFGLCLSVWWWWWGGQKDRKAFYQLILLTLLNFFTYF